MILAALPFPTWYYGNWYAAGLVDQNQLIEFGMEEDFLYCNKWRPELFKQENIHGYDYYFDRYKRSNVHYELDNTDTVKSYTSANQLKSQKTEFSQLTWVAKYGYDRILNKLLEINDDFVNESPLYQAIKHDRTDCIKVLFEQQIVQMWTDEYNMNGYHLLALHNGSQNSARLLIDMFDIEETDINEVTPLELATEKHNHEILDFLLERKAKITDESIFIAVETNNMLALKKFSKHRSLRRPEERVPNQTYLHHLINFKGDNKMAKFLINNGVQINAKKPDIIRSFSNPNNLINSFPYVRYPVKVIHGSCGGAMSTTLTPNRNVFIS